MAKTMLSIIARNKVQFSPSGWRLCACVCLPLISGSVALALSFTTRQVNTIPPLSYLPISFLAKQPSDWLLQASWPKVIRIILISGIINQIGLVSACVPAIMKLQAEWRGRGKMASRCRLRRLASLGGPLQKDLRWDEAAAAAFGAQRAERGWRRRWAQPNPTQPNPGQPVQKHRVMTQVGLLADRGSQPPLELGA